MFTWSGNERGLIRLVAALCYSVLACALSACQQGTEGGTANVAAPSATAAASAEGSNIMARSRATEDVSDSTLKVRARVREPDGTTREIRMTVYRKRESDGRRLMFLEITSPKEERDRSGLVSFTAAGDLEATRYLQSNDSFVTTTSAVSEDSLFGLSLQELADGQPEKYEQRLIGETTVGDSTVYRIEGRLKQGAESKFTRVVTFVSKENLTVVGTEYYDNHDQLTRRLTVERIEKVDGRWTRMRWTIDNRSRGKRIEFETTGIKYENNLPASIFSREHLKKSASR
ncbi:MAG TPA: outer membrane lipoprotein-sorting protein [Blastocatellia bacterium]|nr:outer membrane lipoprotein-sorting protein [Blastocatellia bacterium]